MELVSVCQCLCVYLISTAPTIPQKKNFLTEELNRILDTNQSTPDGEWQHERNFVTGKINICIFLCSINVCASELSVYMSIVVGVCHTVGMKQYHPNVVCSISVQMYNVFTSTGFETDSHARRKRIVRYDVILLCESPNGVLAPRASLVLFVRTFVPLFVCSVGRSFMCSVHACELSIFEWLAAVCILLSQSHQSCKIFCTRAYYANQIIPIKYLAETRYALCDSNSSSSCSGSTVKARQ